MKKQPLENEPGIDSGILSLLQHHRGGQILTDLSHAMRQATESAQLMGKKSAITLKINIDPAKNAAGAVVVTDDIKITLPKEEKKGSFFFSDDKGNLYRDDPRQKELPLRVIESAAVVEVSDLKKVGAN